MERNKLTYAAHVPAELRGLEHWLEQQTENPFQQQTPPTSQLNVSRYGPTAQFLLRGCEAGKEPFAILAAKLGAWAQ